MIVVCSQYSVPPGRDLKPEPSEQEAETLPN